MFVGPWGDVLVVRDDDAGVVAGVVDPQRLAEVREKLPALRHRTLVGTA
jgi:nitrilase